MFKKSLLAIAMFPVAAMADINITVPMELEYDNVYSAQSSADENANLFATIEPEITVGITEQLSFFGQIVLEDLGEANGDDRYLEDHGFYINEFKLQYDTEQFGVWAGKSGVNFGRAWDAPGLFTSGLAEDYEMTEKLGLGGSFNAGPIAISVAAFQADDNLFDKSYIETREVDSISDSSFGSYTVAVDGEAGTVSYHVAYGDIDNGKDEDNTKMLVAGIDITIEAGGLEIVPMAELLNAERGNADFDYLTLAVEVSQGPIGGVLGYSKRDEDSDETKLLQFSTSYAFNNGLELGAGISQEEANNGDKTNTIGLIAAYELSYDL